MWPSPREHADMVGHVLGVAQQAAKWACESVPFKGAFTWPNGWGQGRVRPGGGGGEKVLPEGRYFFLERQILAVLVIGWPRRELE